MKAEDSMFADAGKSEKTHFTKNNDHTYLLFTT